MVMINHELAAARSRPRILRFGAPGKRLARRVLEAFSGGQTPSTVDAP
jgi:hypothetical protein